MTYYLEVAPDGTVSGVSQAPIADMAPVSTLPTLFNQIDGSWKYDGTSVYFDGDVWPILLPRIPGALDKNEQDEYVLSDAAVAAYLNTPTSLNTGGIDGPAALTQLFGIAASLGAVVADFKPIWNYPDWMSRCESGLEKGRLADVQALLAVIPITLSEASETAITQALGSMLATWYNTWRRDGLGLGPAAVTEQDVAAARA